MWVCMVQVCSLLRVNMIKTLCRDLQYNDGSSDTEMYCYLKSTGRKKNERKGKERKRRERERERERESRVAEAQ